MAIDLYSSLGVLPDAEHIVIVAAYRALAQRYHPDKWQGDPAVSHSRVAEINEAYRVLGDKILRAQYDLEHTAAPSQDFQSAEQRDNDQAFDDALRAVEERWEIALRIFPDLGTHRARLSRISTALAFGYVTLLLESREFEKRDELAARLEQRFLQRYFGTEGRILNYARQLIFSGNRAAARGLNQLVDVVGSSVDSELIIRRMEVEFNVKFPQGTYDLLSKRRQALLSMAWAVRNYERFADAEELATELGYKLTEVSVGLFKSVNVHVIDASGQSQHFEKRADFTHWVKEFLCPLV